MLKENGLTQKEAKKLLEKHGKNEIQDIGKISWITILWRQIKGNFIIYLLLAAMIISFLVGKSITGWVIAVVIFVVITAGFVQEYKAEKAITSLKGMLMPVTIVIRDGEETEIPSTQIVPGDILILRNGEKIPADCIILSEKDLILDESVLTGESKEIKKTASKNRDSVSEESALFMGSFITNGKCTALVTKTGMQTQFGKIATMISTAQKELPLQNKINKIAKVMAVMAITIALITGVFALLETSSFSQTNMVEILILVIALSVSAFPEGLPVVLITTLSAGTYRMAKQNAIVNRMSIIETLGETTVICSDKTGTITKGEMTVKKIIIGQRKYEVEGIGYEAKGDFMLDGRKTETKRDENLKLLLKACTLCNDAKISRTGEDMVYKTIGSPTEAALLIMAAKDGIFKEDLKAEIVDEVPFSSERKQMAVITKEGKDKTIYSKGAPEVVLKTCNYIKKENGVFKISERDRKQILEDNAKLTSGAFRTLGIAYKNSGFEKMESDLIFLGIVAMEDPPRDEMREALRTCKKAGIQVKMITGDNKETAIAIAKQIGLGIGQVIEGYNLDSMSDKILSKIIGDITIFARVKPNHKIRIVKILKEKGEIVTMTGDGVNDAPALKEAHIGVAMGINGTDVSRSVADLTLKDDNFATIITAVKEGRTIFHNIRKFTSYQLSCNYAELAILFFGVLFAPLLGWPIPVLLALQILFMNLVTDNLPALTLGFNKSSPDIMEEKSMKKRKLLNKNLFKLIAFAGVFMCVLTLIVFYISYNILHQHIEYARSTALATLIILEITNAFNFRSFRKGVANRDLLVNKYLVYASIISVIATVVILYTPVNTLFGTHPITFADWLITLAAAILLIITFDILKKINNKKQFWNENVKEPKKT